MTNAAISQLLGIIEDTDRNRAYYEWQKKHNPHYKPVANIEALEIHRLGKALQTIIKPQNRRYELRGY